MTGAVRAAASPSLTVEGVWCGHTLSLIYESSDEEDVVEKQKNSLLTISAWLTLGGALLAFGPLLLALILAGLTGDFPPTFGESEGVADQELWLVFVTLPLGGLIAVIGLVLLVVSLMRALRMPRPYRPF